MKKIYWLALLALAGCNSDPAPPPPQVSNSRRNEITEREQLVETYATADVVGVPAQGHEWLVRDTNGVVWFVNTEQGKEGRTRMFGWHEEWPKPAPPPILYMTNWITNAITITNYIVEDPPAPKPH